MNKTVQKIRIAIHIGVEPGTAGGTAQSTQGLVRSLGELEGPEEFILVAQTREQAEWIERYRGPNQKLVIKPRFWRPARTNGLQNGRGLADRIRSVLRPPVRATRWLMTQLNPPPETVRISDGYYESLDCDVLHFPTQAFIVCAVPTIYNPHDLQHLHYPQFFTPEELAWREVVYRNACQFAHTVVVGSEWIKKDVLRQYNARPDKVQVIPWAPPTEQYAQVSPGQVEKTAQEMGLPATFAFYPAVTWPHKNHVRLLEAIANLRDRRGLIVNLVCSGSKGAAWPKIGRRIDELKLTSQVRFLGFVSETDLRALYRSAQFVVLPSLFEADSCPIYEAWSEGTAVASSNHTALPDQVGDAGLLFDAGDVTAIEQALERMATDPLLRRYLIERGHQRVKDFNWNRTARAFRAVYRRAAALTLNDEDRWLLSWDWMKEPNKAPSLDVLQ